MAQERGRTSRAAVGARLEDYYQVANLGSGQFNAVPQQVNRCAELTDHARGLARRFVHSVADRDWVVTPDYLPEVTRCRELMMQSPVNDQIGSAARLFTVNYAGHIHPAFADYIPPKLHDDACGGQSWADLGSEKIGNVLPDQGQVERRVLFEVRYSEPAAEVQVTNRPGYRVGESKNELYRRSLASD